MRDPNRTYPFCRELAIIWSDKYPDMRFGQLMYNFIVWCSNTKKRDILFPEEKEFMELFKEFCGVKDDE